MLLIQGSTDGAVFATTDNTGGVAIYDAKRFELDRVARFPEQYWFDISPDGATLAGSTFEDRPVLALVETTSGRIHRVPLPDGADFVAAGIGTAFASDGSSFVTVECRPCEEGRIVLVRRDPIDGSERTVTEIPAADFAVDRIDMSSDGRVLAMIGVDEEGRGPCSSMPRPCRSETHFVGTTCTRPPSPETERRSPWVLRTAP